MRPVHKALVLLSLLVLADVTAGALGLVPVWNRTYRLLSGAPAVHVGGQLLIYSGRFPTSEEYLVPYTRSDKALQLYKARGTPELPPWVFVPRHGEPSFRYKRPR